MTLRLAIPVLWAIAALGATLLRSAPTARAVRGRTLIVLAIVALAIPVTVLGLRQQPLAVLVGAGAAAVGLVSAPRLVRLRRAARGIAAAGPGTPAPPALRAAAGQPQIVSPLHGTAYAALAGLIVSLTSVSPKATVLPVLLAIAIDWGWSAWHQPVRVPRLVFAPPKLDRGRLDRSAGSTVAPAR